MCEILVLPTEIYFILKFFSAFDLILPGNIEYAFSSSTGHLKIINGCNHYFIIFNCTVR